MIQVWKENWYFAAAGAVLLIVGLLAVNRFLKDRKQKKEQYTKRMKDQVLNEALKNNLGRRNAFKKPDQAVPLEEERQQNPEESVRNGQIVMKLTVTGAKTESYVVNPEEHVLLGSADGMNDIILKDRNIAQQQCDIFLYKNSVYVRSLNDGFQMALRRRSSQTPVGGKGIRILTGDQILMGNYRIQVTLMDYVGNVISG